MAMMGQGDPRWLRRVVKLDEPLDRRECYVVSIKLRSMENYAVTCGNGYRNVMACGYLALWRRSEIYCI